MKKIILSIVVAVSSLAANAQNSVATNGFWDNWSVGVQAGVYEPTVGQNMLKDMRPGINIEITKDITPAFGLSVNYFAGINANNANDKATYFLYNAYRQKTAFDFSNLGFNALINLNNLFCGYNESRAVEVVARAGSGWGYVLGECYRQHSGHAFSTVTANFGLDFNFNLGAKKAITLNVKPAISYWNVGSGLNVHESQLTLLAGVTYHFNKSNFDPSISAAELERLKAEFNARLVDYESEIARLRNEDAKNHTEIANLKAELAKKPKEIVKVEKETTQLAPVVIFRQGKSVIDASQRPSVDMIATYMKNHPESKVTINGYASPEGSADLNQKLSDARAKAVYNMLVNTYKIDASRLTYKGLGVTDELFSENDWNRVVVFIEESKK